VAARVTGNPEPGKTLGQWVAKNLVVGGYAVMLYTEPRYTKDLDIWIEASAENALLVFKALAEFGAPLAGIHAEDFTAPDLIYNLACRRPESTSGRLSAARALRTRGRGERKPISVTFR
jgi:hypothetical protein